jgi:hypothetical protein
MAVIVPNSDERREPKNKETLFSAKLPKGFGQMSHNIPSQKRHSSLLRFRQITGPSVKVNPEDSRTPQTLGRIVRGHLGQESGNESGQDITRSPRRHSGISGPVDKQMIPIGDNRLVSFQNDNRSKSEGRLPCREGSVLLNICRGKAKETRHFPRMGRENHRGKPAQGPEPCQSVQTVRIQNSRERKSQKQLTNEPLNSCPRPQTWAKRHRRNAPRPQKRSNRLNRARNHAAVSVGERKGHGLPGTHRVQGLQRLGNAHGHKTRPATQRAQRGQTGRAHHSARPANNENVTKIVFVGVRFPLRKPGFKPFF